MIPEIVRQTPMRPGLQAKGPIVDAGHMPKSYELTWRA
jgi:hypothetical protein